MPYWTQVIITQYFLPVGLDVLPIYWAMEWGWNLI